MLSTLSSFQRQLSSIMETLVQTAVLEISRLVDVECEVLLSELTRRNTPSSSEDTGHTLTHSSTCVKRYLRFCFGINDAGNCLFFRRNMYAIIPVKSLDTSLL